jgi:hypothetical protein
MLAALEIVSMARRGEPVRRDAGSGCSVPNLVATASDRAVEKESVSMTKQSLVRPARAS